MNYTRQEMMAIATGREIRDGELAIFGVGLSMLAGYFAQACHAPRVRAMTEGGIYGSTPIGGLGTGAVVSLIGAPGALIVAGGLALIATAYAAARWRAIL